MIKISDKLLFLLLLAVALTLQQSQGFRGITPRTLHERVKWKILPWCKGYHESSRLTQYNSQHSRCFMTRKPPWSSLNNKKNNDDDDDTSSDNGTWKKNKNKENEKDQFNNDNDIDNLSYANNNDGGNDSLEASIDSFLRGEYDREFAEDAPSPYPGLTPGKTIELVLQSIRQMDEPHPSHGAAVLMRFNVPLTRAERWGGGTTCDPWKEVIRGAITPSMLARRIRASEFSTLLDWKSIDVTEGATLHSSSSSSNKKKQNQNKKKQTSSTTSSTTTAIDATVPSLAFVNAALFFGNGLEPSIVQFTLRRVNGVWLIDKAQVLNKQELFVQEEMDEDDIGEGTDYM